MRGKMAALCVITWILIGVLNSYGVEGGKKMEAYNWTLEKMLSLLLDK